MRRKWDYGVGIVAVSTVMAFAGAVQAGLVDHYMFEDNGVDSAGGDANGTVGANVTFGPGRLGQAAIFGTGGSSADRITVPLADAFAPGMSDFSIAFWAKREFGDSGNPDGVLDALNQSGYQIIFKAANSPSVPHGLPHSAGVR